MSKEKRDCGSLLIAAPAVFFFFLWLSHRIPYTHDDWDWGLPLGMLHLVTADINSRYTGNLIEVLLTRSPLLKTALMALVFTAILVLSSRAAMHFAGDGSKIASCNLKALIVCCAAAGLFFSLPADIWKQTNGWVAGFANYVISALALIVFFALVFRERKVRSRRTAVLSAAAYLVFGFAIQLLLENLTVYFLAVSLVSSLYLFIKNRKRAVDDLMMLAGNIIGAVIMFSSNIYSSLWNDGSAIDGYRQMQYDRSQPFTVFLRDALMRYLTDFVRGTVNRYALLTFFLALVLLIITARKVFAKGTLLRGIYVAFMAADLIAAIYYLYTWRSGIPEALSENTLRNAVPELAFVILITLEIIFVFRCERRLLGVLMTVWSAPFIFMVPMLSINTVGPRNYYSGITALTLLVLILLAYYMRDLKVWQVSGLGIAAAVLAGFAVVHMAAVYGDIGKVNAERIRMIRGSRSSSEAQVLVLPAFPHEEYLWNPDPNNAERVDFYRKYYGVPENIQLEFPNGMRWQRDILREAAPDYARHKENSYEKVV